MYEWHGFLLEIEISREEIGEYGNIDGSGNDSEHPVDDNENDNDAGNNNGDIHGNDDNEDDDGGGGDEEDISDSEEEDYDAVLA